MKTTLSAKLSAEQLDERTLPAVALNLGSVGAQAAANGFIAQQANVPASESETFLRLDGARTQEGYNTTARRSQFDEVRGNYSRALTLEQIPVVVVNGVRYREFLLSVNENRSSPRLSLDEVQIFVASRSNLTGYNERRGTLGGLRPVFDLDAGGDVSIIVDDRVNGRGRASDMTLLIPDAAFANANAGSFIYLYSEMGSTFGARASGGYEEWSVRTVFAPPPPPSNTASLSGYVFLDSNGDGLKDEGEQGIAGVVIVLDGVNDLGETITMTVETDANGFYSFTALRAGTYNLQEEQPGDYSDGDDFLGTADGFADNDFFGSIALAANQQGQNYNFTERLIVD